MPRTKKKVKSIVKTKVISARVTEVVHELLHQQAEDAGMTLSECGWKHEQGRIYQAERCLQSAGR